MHRPCDQWSVDATHGLWKNIIQKHLGRTYTLDTTVLHAISPEGIPPDSFVLLPRGTESHDNTYGRIAEMVANNIKLSKRAWYSGRIKVDADTASRNNVNEVRKVMYKIIKKTLNIDETGIYINKYGYEFNLNYFTVDVKYNIKNNIDINIDNNIDINIDNNTILKFMMVVIYPVVTILILIFLNFIVLIYIPISCINILIIIIILMIIFLLIF